LTSILTSNLKLNQALFEALVIHLLVVFLNIEELLHKGLAQLILNVIARRLQLLQDIDTPKLLKHHRVRFQRKYQIENLEHISQYRLHFDATLQCLNQILRKFPRPLIRLQDELMHEGHLAASQNLLNRDAGFFLYLGPGSESYSVDDH
jgi:hypothetical protein